MCTLPLKPLMYRRFPVFPVPSSRLPRIYDLFHTVTVAHYLPPNVTEIVVIGGHGLYCAFADEYAMGNGIKLTEYPPDKEGNHREALHNSFRQVIQNSDSAVLIWERFDTGMQYAITL